MSCSSSYVTADQVSEFFCRGEGYGASSEPMMDDVDRYILSSAARINLSLSASGQCACTLSEWAGTYLRELNLVAASLMIHCPDCNRHFTVEERDFWNTWLGEQLELIRSGRLELCAGETAVDYPSITWAEQATTEFAAAQIIYNDLLRSAA